MNYSYRLNPQLQQLTVQDWKRVCSELHLRVAGRKEEVQRRALSYLHSEEGLRRAHAPESSELLKHVAQILGLPLPKSARVPVMQDGNNFACLCAGAMLQGDAVQCGRCKTWQHRQCVGKAIHMRGYQCLTCQLQQIEPLDQVLDTILEAGACSTAGQGNVRQFPYLPKTGEKAMTVERSVQIRCIKVDDGGFLQRWPKDGVVYLNGKSIEDFAVAPGASTQPGSRNRKDFPVVVKALIPGAQNEIAVLKRRENDLYAFGIFLVENIPVEVLISRLATEQVLSIEEGRAFVAARVTPEDEVQAANYSQVLRCPLTRLLPDLPVRGFRCQHVQCFDLASFVILQESAKTNRWRCPICRLPAFRLVLDKFIQKVLEEAKVVGNCFTVEFSSGGEYRLVQEVRDMDEDYEDEPWRLRRRPGGLRFGDPFKRAKNLPHRLTWADFSTGRVSLFDVCCTSAYTNAIRWTLV